MYPISNLAISLLYPTESKEFIIKQQKMQCSSTTQRNFLSKSTAENLSIYMQCTYFILNHASFVQTGLLLDICLCMISNGGDYLWLLWNR